jgi:hypothetical protein
MPHPDHRRFPVVPPRPSVPLPYLAGTVELLGEHVHNLLELIWQHINRDCPGTSKQLRVWADPSNQAPVWIGQFAGNPLQKHGEQTVWDEGEVGPSIWDGGTSHWDGTETVWFDNFSVWDNGKSRWDVEYTKPNEGRPGTLSVKHYGYFLTPMGEPRIYQSAYPGDNTPIGHLQVYSEAPARLHVEINE